MLVNFNQNIKKKKVYKNFVYKLVFKEPMGIGDWGLGIGDWGLGMGDWGLAPHPNPQSPIPNPQSPR